MMRLITDLLILWLLIWAPVFVWTVVLDGPEIHSRREFVALTITSFLLTPLICVMVLLKLFGL